MQSRMISPDRLLGEKSVNHGNERISHAKGDHHTYDDLVAIPVWLLFHSSSLTPRRTDR